MPRFGEWPVLFELLLFANLLAVLIELVPLERITQFSLPRFAAYLFFINWVTFTYASLVNGLRGWLTRLPIDRSFFWCWIILVLVVGFFSLMGDGVLHFLHLKHWDASNNFATAVQRMAVGAIMGWLILRYLYLRQQLLLRQRAEMVSRVQALQARIRPHFLFNTMNMLLELVESGSPKAAPVIENLSSLFRTSLSAKGEVPLQDEIDLCKQYLAIEQLRLGERLQVEWNLPDEEILYELMIPSLTLQPLLENAIYHGVESRFEPSLIRIAIEADDQQIRLVMTNPYQMSPRQRPGNSMALDNIRERLKAYYGQAASLTLHQTGERFTVYLAYPLLDQVT